MPLWVTSPCTFVGTLGSRRLPSFHDDANGFAPAAATANAAAVNTHAAKG